MQQELVTEQQFEKTAAHMTYPQIMRRLMGSIR